MSLRQLKTEVVQHEKNNNLRDIELRRRINLLLKGGGTKIVIKNPRRRRFWHHPQFGYRVKRGRGRGWKIKFKI